MLHLEIVTPDKVLFDDEVKSFSAPGFEGGFQVLPRHAPYITSIKPGKVKLVTKDDSQLLYAVSSGTVEVHADKITMLAEYIIPKESIDIEEAEREKKDAEKMLSLKEPGTDLDAVKNKLDIAKAKINVYNFANPA